jgi:isopentenyl diphosphate isomerase/L-lactate dehydrogenase-like FMN-dependent dehydrogenase
MLPLLAAAPKKAVAEPAVVPAELLLTQSHLFEAGCCVALLPNDRMGELVPRVRRLAEIGVAAVALDQSVLADTAPYGSQLWKPRTREELSELRVASGLPFWLYGVSSTDDAQAALEAGLEGIVVNSAAGVWLGGPCALEILPEILDSVAGTLSVIAGARVRDGLDVFRLLAVGAEAVIVEGDRNLASLEAELHYAMRVTGCATLSDIGYDVIFAPLFDKE